MMKLTNWSRGAAAGTMALLLMIGTPVQAADNPQVAAEIMALARAQWASEIAGEPMAQQNTSLADDYTEFNGEFPTLLVGKTMSTRMGEVTPYDKAMYLRHAERPGAGLRRYRHPHLQFRRVAARGGRKGQSVTRQIDAGLCQARRPVATGPCQLRSGSRRPLVFEESRPVRGAALAKFSIAPASAPKPSRAFLCALLRNSLSYLDFA